jgi:hypothetical protein
MKYLREIKRSIGFIFVLLITVVMMIGFSAGVVKAEPFELPSFDSDSFPDTPNINNPFMTLKPGAAFCYEAETEDGTETNEVTVTDCNLEIADVNTIVVRDAVRLDDELTEDTYDFYAQDEEGNVWYLGEATKECEDDNTDGTWNADEPGAEPGIVMLADPIPGNTYMQEFLEGIAEDMGKVLRLNANVSEYCDKDCLETKEWSPLELGAVEHKYYARDLVPGIGGLVLVEELKGKTVITELVEVVPSGAVSGNCPVDLEDALDALCTSPPPANCD